MNIQTEKAYMIFRSVVEDKIYHKLGMSKKKQDGSFENGYILVQFKKDVDIPDRTKIYIRQAWLTFYKKKVTINGSDFWDTIPYIFINDFITMAQQIENNRVDFDEIEKKKAQISQVYNTESTEDPYENFGEEVIISDEDLPF